MQDPWSKPSAFYGIKNAYEEHGIEGLKGKTRRKHVSKTGWRWR
jgi:hypothetical protein